MTSSNTGGTTFGVGRLTGNSIITKDELDIEESETSLLQSLDSTYSTKKNVSKNDNSTEVGSRDYYNNNSKTPANSTRFRTVARRTIILEQTRRSLVSLLQEQQQQQQNNNNQNNNGSKKQQTNAVFAPSRMLIKLRNEEKIRHRRSRIDSITTIDDTFELQKLFMEDDDIDNTADNKENNTVKDDKTDDSTEEMEELDESLPFVRRHSNITTSTTSIDYGSMMVANVQQQRTNNIITKKKRSNNFQNIVIKWYKTTKSIFSCQKKNPLDSIKYIIYHILVSSYIGLFVIPLVLLALVLYYCCNNPTLSFFTIGRLNTNNTITISWFCNFIARQIILYEVSSLLQWFLLDCCFVGTTGSTSSTSASNNTRNSSKGSGNTTDTSSTKQFRVGGMGNTKTNIPQILGPYITLVTLQSRGIPFIITSIAILNILFIRGTSQFHNHWLYFTGWKIYSTGTSGDVILSSTIYFRILVSMIIIGISITFKRSIITTRFGRRLLAEFQPRMEVLLADIVLMNEIAVLAEQVGAAADVFDQNNSNSIYNSTSTNSITVSTPPTSNATGRKTTTPTATTPAAESALVESSRTSRININVDDELEAPHSQDEPISTTTNISSTSATLSSSTSNNNIIEPSSSSSNFRKDNTTMTNRTESGLINEEITWATVNRTREEESTKGRMSMMNDTSDNSSKTTGSTATGSTAGGNRRSRQQLQSLTIEKSSSGNIAIKNLLDQWEDPVAALSVKAKSFTIQDVLRFKRALGYMDDPHPFGDAFGPASDRDEAIESAHHVYGDLTKFEETSNMSDMVDTSTDNNRTLSSASLSSKRSNINFDLLALIATDENGEIIQAKYQALKKLFRPDARNELSLLAFVQSCDNVYKRLRFFRAAVSNSSAIDAVLGYIIDFFFGFILILVILEVLDYDPWTLLLSMTSLLVSVSFALGSSTSQFVEGLLLIAGRRPFDLGDRILIIGSESQDKPSPTESYFVEDISLLKTTVRFARTNEVSTINNFSISKSRIVNLQRSSNANIFIEMKFDTSIFSNSNLVRYRTMLEEYIRENTRSWECINFIRHDEIDADYCTVLIRFSFRHRYSWQYAARIMVNRADLVRYMYDKGVELDIHWLSSVPIRAIYDGGEIEGDTILGRRVNTKRPPFNKTRSEKAD